MSKDNKDLAAGGEGGAVSEEELMKLPLFDPEFCHKAMMYKLQHPSEFASDFFNDESGIEEPPDITKDMKARMLWAAENGKLDIVKSLFESDPRLISVKDNDLYTPLHRAAYNNHTEVVKYLLEIGADACAKTEDGWQPLHSAARWGSVDSAKLLIGSGKVDINALTNGNLTPLHLAVSGTEPGNVDMVKLLLDQPSLIKDIKDNAGDTPYDVARQTSAQMMQLFDEGRQEIEKHKIATGQPSSSN